MLAPGSDELYVAAHRGLASDLSRNLRFKIGEGRVGSVAQRRVPMTERDFEHEVIADRHPNGKKPQFNFDPAICAPVIFQNRLLGVLTVADLPVVSDQEKQLLMVIAQASAIALNNALSFEQLQDSAAIDGLTKLYNVQYFRERLREEVKRAQRFQHPFSLIIMDLDNFKNYNDTHGHLMGDRLLVQFANVVKKVLRETDLIARYGGDEFIILCPETDKKQGGLAAERIRKVLGDFPFAHRESQPLGLISISAGVATYPEDGLQPEELIKAADESLYEAKRAGRNRVVVTKPIRLKQF
ncbi:MAG: sensor domain-containing diguanylate cyclase, partial [candidate division WOR-3 bacterium]